MDNDIPINVVLIPDLTEDRESLIEAYVDIIRTCKRKSELRSAVEMMFDEVSELSTKQIFIRLVQHMGELLDKK
jgi:hypothetical protein